MIPLAIRELSRRHRTAALVSGMALAAGLIFGAIAVAQQVQGEDPPFPPTMPEPPGKPQYEGTPTPDPLKTPTSRICDSTPELCGLARGMGTAFAAKNLAALTTLLTPTEVQCYNPGSVRPLPGRLCDDKESGAVVAGYTITGGGKQATLLSEAEFRERLTSWLELPGQSGYTPKPVSVGCAITPSESVDCTVTAVAIGLFNPKRDAMDGTIVLFFRRDYGERPFGLVGASGGLPDGAVLTGGTERRIMAGWTGNETGYWYFELLD